MAKRLEQRRHINVLPLHHALLDHRECAELETGARKSQDRLPSMLVLNIHPDHSKLLGKGVAQANAKRLQLPSFVRVEPPISQDCLDNSEFPADLVILCAFALKEMSAKPFSQLVQVGPIVIRELRYLFLHGSPLSNAAPLFGN